MWKHFLTFYLKLLHIQAKIVPFVFVWVDFCKCQAVRRSLCRWHRADLDETTWEIMSSSPPIVLQAWAQIFCTSSSKLRSLLKVQEFKRDCKPLHDQVWGCYLCKYGWCIIIRNCLGLRDTITALTPRIMQENRDKRRIRFLLLYFSVQVLWKGSTCISSSFSHSHL